MAVGLGAMFHDFGKVRVPLAILTSGSPAEPGPLTGWEMEVVRHHPEWVAKRCLEDLQATDVAIMDERVGRASRPCSPRHYDTFSHSVCVAAFTVSLGLRVGISAPQEILAVGLGAMFHDFGKVRVPLAILTKPGPLTGWEMEVVRHHPEWGQALLEDLQATDVAMEPVLYHHERFNGTGYPAGLRREEIPFSARVAAVADVFHAITSRRPYRGPLDMYAAAELMVRRMPGHFDPDVLREFILLLGGGKRSAPGPSVGASG